MSIIIGHASIAETGGINGKKGDSTGKEVCTRSWYNKDWLNVFRPKDDKTAYTMVQGMLAACDNKHIGYGQSDRLTLYNALMDSAKANKRSIYNVDDIKKLNTNVNCDCSSLIAVLLNLAGYKVNPSMVTYNEYNAVMNTGAFENMPNVYTYTPNLLKAGDILLSSGHTALVVSNDLNAPTVPPTSGRTTASQPAYDFTPEIAGKYIVQVDDFLALRDGASADTQLLTSLPPLHTVQCYGYHTNAWYYVQTLMQGSMYTGFCHSKYLHKV